MPNSLENLPPEMQARIQSMIAGANPNAAPPQEEQQQAALAQRPLSLMDHVIQLRQENQFLRQQVEQLTHQMAASAQVTEAVGNAVGQLYQMFCQQTETTSYSSNFETTRPSLEDEF